MQIVETTRLSRVTGVGEPNDTATRFGIHGTDLGFIWDAGPGAGGDPRVFVMFGDTYGEGWAGPGAGPATAQWRKNTLAVSTDRDLGSGLRLDAAVSWPERGIAAQVIRSLPRWIEHTVIPCSGITVGGVHYVHWMSILKWLGPGRWRTSHAGIAVSVDDGLSWRKLARWWNPTGRERFQVGCFARDDEWIYLYGTTNGRFGPAFVARTRPADIGQRRAYRYFDGRNWVRGAHRAAPVLPGNVGELSVARHDQHGWLAMHLDERRAAILVRRAPEPTGPWTDGEPVADAAAYPGLYGGFIHPWCLAGGPLYWTMSQWDDYDVFWMRTELG